MSKQSQFDSTEIQQHKTSHNYCDFTSFTEPDGIDQIDGSVTDIRMINQATAVVDEIEEREIEEDNEENQIYHTV